MTMRYVLAALVLSVLAACQQGVDANTPTPSTESDKRTAESDSRAAKQLRTAKAAYCACADAICIKKVQEDYADFMNALEDKYSGAHKPTAEIIAISTEIRKCIEDASKVPDVTAH